MSKCDKSSGLNSNEHWCLSFLAVVILSLCEESELTCQAVRDTWPSHSHQQPIHWQICGWNHPRPSSCKILTDTWASSAKISQSAQNQRISQWTTDSWIKQMDGKWVTQFGAVLTDSKKERVDTTTFPYRVVSFIFHILIHATTIYYNLKPGRILEHMLSLTSTARPTSSYN